MGLVVDEPIRLGSASGRLQLQYREFRQLVDHPQYKPSACIRLSGSVSSRSKLVTPCFFKQVVAGHNDPNDWMDVACVAMSNGVTISVGTWLTTNARFIRQKAAQVRFRVILAPPAPRFPRVTQVTNLVLARLLHSVARPRPSPRPSPRPRPRTPLRTPLDRWRRCTRFGSGRRSRCSHR